MAEYSTVAAVDLGTNSFHCQIARVVGDQLYPLDSLREPVRLGAGLDDEKVLDEAAQSRALACLQRFGERLRGFDPHAVRAIGTNTLRVAKNARPFLKRAHAALGFPIEVVAGREEARLIYLGVIHSLPPSQEKRLVVDIGGGSTEVIIGAQYRPQKLDSLFMGCVSYSRRFFPDGKITKRALKQAEVAARAELQTIAGSFARGQWQEAVGSSGTARALADLIEQNELSKGGITAEGLEALRAMLLRAGDVEKLQLAGLRPDRIPVLPGGLAIMSAVFRELDVQRMIVASGAMRQGVLYDMLGRFQHHDMRDVTIAQFMQRYHVDAKQSRRVGNLAAMIHERFTAGDTAPSETAPIYLGWAAKLHEIGVSVAYSGYHKHSAYIIANGDMPGFSKDEQTELSLIVLAHRRSLRKVLEQIDERVDWDVVLALRLAAIFCRARTDVSPPITAARRQERKYRMQVDAEWLMRNPMTATALQEEVREWSKVGFDVRIPELETLDTGADGLSGTAAP